jgi:transposase
MRLKGSADVLEHRRRRALALLDEGRSLNEVARLVGSAPSSVMRWRNARRRGGIKALKVRFSPGRPSKLTATQRRKLVRRLVRGAMAYGYQTDLWTTGRIAYLIEREFGVRYHADHVGRLMHDLDWSHQKPQRRALERNTKAIERWKREDWPRVKKTPLGWAPISSSPMNRASS